MIDNAPLLRVFEEEYISQRLKMITQRLKSVQLYDFEIERERQIERFWNLDMAQYGEYQLEGSKDKRFMY